MVMAGETKGFLRAYGTLVWGTMATVYSLGHLGYLLMLAPSTNPITGGAGLFLFIPAILLEHGLLRRIFVLMTWREPKSIAIVRAQP